MMLVLRLDDLLRLPLHRRRVYRELYEPAPLAHPGPRKFQPGDRVRVEDGTWHTGTIVRYCPHPAWRPHAGGYLIRLEDGHYNRPDGLYHAPTRAIVSA